MRRITSLIALAAFVAAPLAAQEHDAGHVDPVTSTAAIQKQFMGWIITAAEQVPEADYAYKPVATVRSMGEQFGHVANANYMICAGLSGKDNPNSTDFEKAGKAEIVAGLKGSMAFCGEVAQWAAEHHHAPVNLFGMKGDVTWAMNFNSAHNAEHYGNIVTYMRMKGMVPPSSQGGM
jgi:uncharacterized damage-inducible protein DinB